MPDLPFDLERLPELAKKSDGKIKAAFQRIKKKNPKDLDVVVHELHEQAFKRIDCLTCANCCRSLGPRITDRDIERLARVQRMKPSVFIERFLRMDEDGDYVFQSMPCPFLADDNRCLVYEDRPKACREYPHTDQRKFVQLLQITRLNCATCPAVYQISEELAERY